MQMHANTDGSRLTSFTVWVNTICCMKDCAYNTLTDVKLLAHLMQSLCHMGMDMACLHETSHFSLLSASLVMADRVAELKAVVCKEICKHPVAGRCRNHDFDECECFQNTMHMGFSHVKDRPVSLADLTYIEVQYNTELQ